MLLGVHKGVELCEYRFPQVQSLPYVNKVYESCTQFCIDLGKNTHLDGSHHCLHCHTPLVHAAAHALLHAPLSYAPHAHTPTERQRIYIHALVCEIWPEA